LTLSTTQKLVIAEFNPAWHCERMGYFVVAALLLVAVNAGISRIAGALFK
jgi:hypothetical protein